MTTCQANPNVTSVVVLLHGILRTKRSMRPLEKALLKENYHVINVDYSSRKKNLNQLSCDVYQQIYPFVNRSDVILHFVTHSMGALIVRELLAQYKIHNIKRIVMIAPPNQGSEIADFFKDNIFFKYCFGPAGQQLTTQYAQNNVFISDKYEIGIIAGNKAISPLSYFLLTGHHDGRVTIESTKLIGMKEHIVLATDHTFILFNAKTISYTLCFLEHAAFNVAQL